MAAGRTLSIGPLRTTYGPADVHFDGERLRLEVYRHPLALIDRYRLVIVAAALLVALASWYLWVGLLGLTVAMLVVAGLSPRRAGELREVLESDIEEMDHVHGALRLHLDLRTADGELRLTGWWWRRRQLDHLQKRLAS